MKLLIVIVCYRVVDLTIDCLRSIAPEIGSVPGARVAVCENGTGGDAAARLRGAIESSGWDRWCDFTEIHPNRGFTGGNNHVIRAALSSADTPDYILLLNADTLVHPGALRALVDFMDAHPKVGIGGSRLESPDGAVQVSAFRYQGIASEFDNGLRLGIVSRLLDRWRVAPTPPTDAREFDWVSGASMIIRREVFQAIGLLDEGYYTYYDDIDFCLNARRAGWPSWYIPSSRVVHLEGASTGIGSTQKQPKRRAPYWFQARRRFFIKNYGALYAALADLAFITGYAAFTVRAWIQRKPRNDPPHFLRDSIRHSVLVTGPRLRDVENPAMPRGEVSGPRGGTPPPAGNTSPVAPARGAEITGASS